jgi:predicted Zn-dependent protease
MGRLEIGLEKPQAAIPFIEKALHYDPQLLEARASLGLAYLRAGRPALAVAQLEQSASLDYYGDLHYMLYKAYRDLGKTELAENALATSQALRRKTAARDQALIRSAESQ